MKKCPLGSRLTTAIQVHAACHRLVLFLRVAAVVGSHLHDLLRVSGIDLPDPAITSAPSFAISNSGSHNRGTCFPCCRRGSRLRARSSWQSRPRSPGYRVAVRVDPHGAPTLRAAGECLEILGVVAQPLLGRPDFCGLRRAPPPSWSRLPPTAARAAWPPVERVLSLAFRGDGLNDLL